jgi:hypothetical protein
MLLGDMQCQTVFNRSYRAVALVRIHLALLPEAEEPP